MKKILPLILSCMLFVACTSNIDKKIDITEYKETIELIKKENTEYSDADYSKASKLLDHLAFKSVSSGSTKTDKTYRALLDEAKAENEKEQAAIKAYNDEIDKMKALLSVNVKQSEYISGYSSILHEDIKMLVSEVEFTNASDKNISGIEGIILVKNSVGDVIQKSYVKLADQKLLPIGKTERDTREYPVIDEFDNVMELAANKPETFQYDWLPELIIFDDGTRVKAPQKPVFVE